MVSTKEALETNYIDTEIVKNSPTRRLVVIGEGTYEINSFGNKRLTLPVEIDAKHKTWQPNRDSIKNCVQILGNDTKAWVGRVILLTIVVNKGKETLLCVPDTAGSIKPIGAL